MSDLMKHREAMRRYREDQRKREIEENRRQFEEAMEANEARYQGALDENRTARQDVETMLMTQGQAARADVNEAFNAQSGSLSARLASRGLGNSSVGTVMRAGINRQRARGLRDIMESVGRMRSNARMGFADQRIGIMEAREDPAPALMFDDGLDALDTGEFSGGGGGFAMLTRSGSLGGGAIMDRIQSGGGKANAQTTKGGERENQSKRRIRLNRERRERREARRTTRNFRARARRERNDWGGTTVR